MIRYRLDDLGWYQFEWLVQALLKAELGSGVEAWGGRGDHGIDAYFPTPLNFPAKHLTSDGPFVFQAKFVENANSAGAKYGEALLRAVRAEAERIQYRITGTVWTARHPVQIISKRDEEREAGGGLKLVLSVARGR